MYCVVTIDTEEDQWDDYFSVGHTLSNVYALPPLQALFAEYGIRPTYLITYPVANDAESLQVLRHLFDENGIEIGSHCHPWNTPPFEEKINPNNTMLCNLPSELQYQKLKILTDRIREGLDIIPVSFRAGRWGYSREVAKNLLKLGYKVESSLTPFVNWAEYMGPNWSGAPIRPFFFDPGRILESHSDGKMLEVPISIGYNRSDFSFWHDVTEKATRMGKTGKLVLGGLRRIGILKKIWLSPEISEGKDMLALIDSYLKKRLDCIHLTFHSTSIFPGLNPFIRTQHDKEIFIDKLKTVFDYVKSKHLKPVTLKEYFQLKVQGSLFE